MTHSIYNLKVSLSLTSHLSLFLFTSPILFSPHLPHPTFPFHPLSLLPSLLLLSPSPLTPFHLQPHLISLTHATPRLTPHLISPTPTHTYPYPLQVSLQLSKYVAEYLQLTPGTWSGRKAPIQYLSKQESWQLLNEEHCFQVCLVWCGEVVWGGCLMKCSVVYCVALYCFVLY